MITEYMPDARDSPKIISVALIFCFCSTNAPETLTIVIDFIVPRFSNLIVVAVWNGCGETEMFALVPFVVAVVVQGVFPVVPPTHTEQLSKKAVPFGIPAQSRQDVSLLPQPQFPAAIFAGSFGQASPAVDT